MTHTIEDGLELFAAVLLDRDILKVDGSEYQVRITPVQRNRVRVEVTLQEDLAFPSWSATYCDDSAAEIHDAAHDCIAEIEDLMRGERDRKEQALIDDDKSIQLGGRL